MNGYMIRDNDYDDFMNLLDNCIVDGTKFIGNERADKACAIKMAILTCQAPIKIFDLAYRPYNRTLVKDRGHISVWLMDTSYDTGKFFDMVNRLYSLMSSLPRFMVGDVVEGRPFMTYVVLNVHPDNTLDVRLNNPTIEDRGVMTRTVFYRQNPDLFEHCAVPRLVQIRDVLVTNFSDMEMGTYVRAITTTNAPLKIGPAEGGWSGMHGLYLTGPSSGKVGDFWKEVDKRQPYPFGIYTSDLK
jgi:hypothetical protein